MTEEKPMKKGIWTAIKEFFFPDILCDVRERMEREWVEIDDMLKGTDCELLSYDISGIRIACRGRIERFYSKDEVISFLKTI